MYIWTYLETAPKSAKPVEQLYDTWRPALMLCSVLCRTKQCQPRPKLQDNSTGSRDDWFLHLLKQTYLYRRKETASRQWKLKNSILALLPLGALMPHQWTVKWQAPCLELSWLEEPTLSCTMPVEQPSVNCHSTASPHESSAFPLHAPTPAISTKII